MGTERDPGGPHYLERTWQEIPFSCIQIQKMWPDCLYLALAVKNGRRFVTADERLVSKIRQDKKGPLHDRIVGLAESLTRKP